MKKNLLIIILILTTAVTHAQRITLPVFLKWVTNNSPDCKNVVLTKDSMVLPVKNKCRSEGQLQNWLPSVGISDGLHFAIPANAKIQLTITYKFIPQGNDVFTFYGSYDPISNNSDESGGGSLQMPVGEDKILPASNVYKTAIILINFSNEISNPVWKSTSASKGDMNFYFHVSYDAAHGETATHQGSKAIIKEVKLEVIK